MNIQPSLMNEFHEFQINYVEQMEHSFIQLQLSILTVTESKV